MRICSLINDATNDARWETSEEFFERLRDLAIQDRDAFERTRHELIEGALIRQVQEGKSLRQLQWKVEAIRCRSKTPLQSLMQINDLMWTSFQCMNDKLSVFTKR